MYARRLRPTRTLTEGRPTSSSQPDHQRARNPATNIPYTPNLCMRGRCATEDASSVTGLTLPPSWPRVIVAPCRFAAGAGTVNGKELRHASGRLDRCRPSSAPGESSDACGKGGYASYANAGATVIRGIPRIPALPPAKAARCNVRWCRLKSDPNVISKGRGS